ncbi:hypothetical protein AWB64_00469 [Caballeronia sordidicola]|uniref:Uncharacterized protein n=1 Tax=Caballeronia sordidicola TaxID=196367 RepID=A0A158EWY4_CABSO|nr:hypothetical protein [Caballeronia sordidicola]SAL12046.1 hypothetical protein AWB64_00469 [Caballeronia sordidicola]
MNKEVTRKPNAFDIQQAPGESDAQTTARTASNGVTRGAAAARAFAIPVFGAIDLTAYEAEIRKKVSEAIGGDLKAVREMLLTQANTLDMVFNRVALMSGDDADSEYLWLALQAQSQCYETIRTLSELGGYELEPSEDQ